MAAIAGQGRRWVSARYARSFATVTGRPTCRRTFGRAWEFCPTEAQSRRGCAVRAARRLPRHACPSESSSHRAAGERRPRATQADGRGATAGADVPAPRRPTAEVPRQEPTSPRPRTTQADGRGAVAATSTVGEYRLPERDAQQVSRAQRRAAVSRAGAAVGDVGLAAAQRQAARHHETVVLDQLLAAVVADPVQRAAWVLLDVEQS